MSTLNSNPFGQLRSSRRSTARRVNRQTALRLKLESLESRRVLATSITGTVIDDISGDGVIDDGEPGQANVRVYVDANGNGQFDSAGTIVEPDDYDDMEVIDASAAGVTFSVANSSNVVDASKSVASMVDVSEGVSVTGTNVFGWTDNTIGGRSPYFSFITRLRADFATPASEVELEFAGGNRAANVTEAGILEAYDSSDNLVDSYQTSDLLLGEWETMSVSGASNIAYIIAYTEIPGANGHMDAMRVDGGASELWTNTKSDGTYELRVPTGGSYEVNEVVPDSYERTLPSGGDGQTVVIATDAVAQDVNFANGAVAPTPGWQNQTNPLDVNNDGFVFAIDALIIINELNEPQYRDVDSFELPTPPAVVPAYFDVNGDGFATASDVILIINYINENPPGEGESSSLIGAAVANDGPTLAADALVAAAVDVVHRHTDGEDE
ncbi:MAG: hypothetical protein KDA92_07700 [Planctomycetales bacterium]|nr:hypothetical protein [Planctomycetales bacterium]